MTGGMADRSSLAPDELVRRVAAALGPLEAVRVAWLFGSRVAGTSHARSDLDIAVVYARGLDDAGRERARRVIVAALTDALGAIGERADVVDVDRTSSSVAFRAIRDGRRVVVRSERERTVSEVGIMRRYDDEAPRRELFRRSAVHHAQRLAGGGR